MMSDSNNALVLLRSLQDGIGIFASTGNRFLDLDVDVSF